MSAAFRLKPAWLSLLGTLLQSAPACKTRVHPPPPPLRFPARLVSAPVIFAPCAFVQRDYCMHIGGKAGWGEL